jgi:hypothetical protein
VPAPIRFADIGDYGLDGASENRVAEMVIAWNPDFIITAGDNNYPSGEAETIDANVGKYYHSYIYPYKGTYGPGATENRFWPVLGNHDWDYDIETYQAYFTLPGNQRYYTLRRGPVEFFMLSSYLSEPDGFQANSKQAAWAQEAMATSDAPWRIVVFHHAPYSSGYWGASKWMQWPFAKWGANLVLAGHDHIYERLEVDGLTYITNGLGGGSRYAMSDTPDPHSIVRFNRDWGALFVEATAERISTTFRTIGGVEVDSTEILKH